jgi:hypothetical protein
MVTAAAVTNGAGYTHPISTKVGTAGHGDDQNPLDSLHFYRLKKDDEKLLLKKRVASKLADWIRENNIVLSPDRVIRVDKEPFFKKVRAKDDDGNLACYRNGNPKYDYVKVLNTNHILVVHEIEGRSVGILSGKDYMRFYLYGRGDKQGFRSYQALLAQIKRENREGNSEKTEVTNKE